MGSTGKAISATVTQPKKSTKSSRKSSYLSRKPPNASPIPSPTSSPPIPNINTNTKKTSPFSTTSSPTKIKSKNIFLKSPTHSKSNPAIFLNPKNKILTKNSKSFTENCTCSPVMISRVVQVHNLKKRLLSKESQFLHNLFQDLWKNSLKSNWQKVNLPKTFHLDGFPTNCLKLTTNNKVDKVFYANPGKKSWRLKKNADKAQKSMKLRITC